MKPEEIDSLTRRVLAVPAEPVGEHLSEDLFIGYSTETLSPEETRDADLHLASCPACAVEMEQLFAATEVWKGEEGRQRLANLHESSRTEADTPEPQPPFLERLTRINEVLAASISGFLASPSRAQAQAGASDARVGQIDLGAGYIGWNISPDQAGNLSIRIGSNVGALDGRQVCLRVGDWERYLLLTRDALGQVGAATALSRDERQEFPADALLEIEIIEDPSDEDV